MLHSDGKVVSITLRVLARVNAKTMTICCSVAAAPASATTTPSLYHHEIKSILDYYAPLHNMRIRDGTVEL